MEIVNSKFYDGFEGEPEVHFTTKTKEQIKRLIVWCGYFNEIMYLVEPVEGRWTSLAYYYHLLLGWRDIDVHEPWLVEKPQEALEQFETIDKALLETETARVLEEICHLFIEGIESNAEIFIEED